MMTQELGLGMKKIKKKEKGENIMIECFSSAINAIPDLISITVYFLFFFFLIFFFFIFFFFFFFFLFLY